jgi:hypothetical protein
MNAIKILEQQGIETFDSGPNVRKEHIAIQCPWCGNADPSHHLNVNKKTGAFSCFRNMQHRGRTPHSLIMKICGCSREAAQALLTDTSDLKQLVQKLLEPDSRQEQNEQESECKPTPGLHRFHPNKVNEFNLRFSNYLFYRGFDYTHHDNLAKIYNLHCALTGIFANRIVFPVASIKGSRSKIVGHIGRCIDNGNLRYLSIPGTVVKQHVLWEDLLMSGGRTLFICEGPFDALRIDYIAKMLDSSDRATCLFGVTPTKSQIEVLGTLFHEFDNLALLLDKDALSKALQMQRSLSHLSLKIKQLPEGVKDPGDLTWEQAAGIVGVNSRL